MRRIDALGIGFGIFIAGGLAYIALVFVGLNNLQAGVWSQVFLVCALVGWVSTYLFRAVGQNMTYHQQREEYEEEYFQKRLEELSDEELAKIQAEVEQDKGNRV